MFKGFRDFIARGNVVDLAIAVVMGTAFTAVVTAVVTNVLNPLIASIGGQKVTGLSWTIVSGNAQSTMDFAAVITALLNFAVIAAVLYFGFVLPVRKLQERRLRGQGTVITPTEAELLTEIRDLLRAKAERDKDTAATRQES